MTSRSTPPNQMLTACIVAGGDVTPGPHVMTALHTSELIIAADRGIVTCLDLGISPALCIGDFDSAPDDAVQAARERGWHLVEHPPEKGATDLELALDEAVIRGARRIRVLGALTGPDRIDHGVANLFLLARPDLAGVDIRLIDEMREAFVIRQGESSPVSGEHGDYVTLLPLSQTGAIITTWGLKYDLLDISLAYGGTRGVSNELAWSHAEITVGDGSILVILERRFGGT